MFNADSGDGVLLVYVTLSSSTETGAPFHLVQRRDGEILAIKWAEKRAPKHNSTVV